MRLDRSVSIRSAIEDERHPEAPALQENEALSKNEALEKNETSPSTSDPKPDELRHEIGFLGTVLGDAIRETSGDQVFAVVEELRRAAWDRRIGRENADQQMKELVAGLDHEQMRVVIRAFTVFLDLLNLVEDRRRVRVLGERARDVYPQPRHESIRDAISELKEAGTSADSLQSLIDQLNIELVFTAHPTEAKRRSVRGKLREIRELMRQYDTDQLPEDRDRTEQRIRAEVAKLWQTDFIRPWRPSVMQEVGRGLSIKPVLWSEVPRISNEIRRALHENYGDAVRLKRPCLKFGSWIGGDRDGHPGVTAEVSEETFVWLRREAIAFHLRTCVSLFHSLSISQRQVELGDGLSDAIDAAIRRWPRLHQTLASLPPGELCRRWLSVIRWRLEQTLLRGIDSAANPTPDTASVDEDLTVVDTMAMDAAYPSACELAADVTVLESSLSRIPGGQSMARELRDWQSQIETFGLHLASLDIRQNARVYQDVLNEIFRLTGLSADPESLDEEGRCRLLQETLRLRLTIAEDEVSDAARETLRLFRTLHRVASQYSMSAIGAHVISMTSAASDVLTVLWLWEQTSDRESGRGNSAGLPIVPLLETIDDLQRGAAILTGMLAIPAYREHLAGLGDQQMIMLGYSDSTKDGGYLSACWSLHRTQQELAAIARQHDIRLAFFHGRGGSLGRGGGPTARSILSLPEGTFQGHLRLTEQGEVLADRYDDPAIAHRHLEQVVWSSLLAAGEPAHSESTCWSDTMERLSATSFTKYRELLQQPAFVEFFRVATPVSEIEQLPIGSRPARRKADGGLADLRAIPWVFSWTQSRCLLPAWYGLGTAMRSATNDERQLEELQQMYQQWPFFRALIDNAELALAKSDLEIASEYAALAAGDDSLSTIASMIAAEYRESCRVVLALTGRLELLDGTPWLKESIRVRNRFIDPLNLIQVELLRRGQQPEREGDDTEERRHLTRLSINGIAAGMRTSG